MREIHIRDYIENLGGVYKKSKNGGVIALFDNNGKITQYEDKDLKNLAKIVLDDELVRANALKEIKNCNVDFTWAINKSNSENWDNVNLAIMERFEPSKERLSNFERTLLYCYHDIILVYLGNNDIVDTNVETFRIDYTSFEHTLYGSFTGTVYVKMNNGEEFDLQFEHLAQSYCVSFCNNKNVDRLNTYERCELTTNIFDTLQKEYFVDID